MKKIAIGLFCIAISCNYISCDSPTYTNTPQQNSQIEATPSQKLATLDANSSIPLDINDNRVLEIERHLKSLSNTFPQTEAEIANATYIATKQLERKGLSYSNIHLLESVDKGDPVYKQANMSYQEFISYIVVMTTK